MPDAGMHVAWCYEAKSLGINWTITWQRAVTVMIDTEIWEMRRL